MFSSHYHKLSYIKDKGKVKIEAQIYFDLHFFEIYQTEVRLFGINKIKVKSRTSVINFIK